MRPRRRRLTTRDRLNIQVGLAAQINLCINRVRNAADSEERIAWAHAAASFIRTSDLVGDGTRCHARMPATLDRWVSELTAAIAEAVAKADAA